jgi:branched-chain amino acid transport system substrate-binding protein
MGKRATRSRGVSRGLAAVVAGALALAASGCGGDDDDGAATEPDTTTAPDVTTEPEATTAPDVTTEPEATTAPDATAEPDGPATTGAPSDGEPAPGVTDAAVTIGVSLPASGPAWEQLRKPYETGFETWAAEVNANGGIHGRQVNLVKIDNLYTTEGGVAACKEARETETFMIITPASGPEEIDCLDEAGIPTYWLAPTTMEPDWTHVVGGSYGPLLAPDIVSFWQSSYLKPGVKKVGIICKCFIPQVEADAHHIAEEAAKAGIEVVIEGWEPNTTSYVAPITRLKDAGVELVTIIDFGESASIIRAAESIGFDPIWTATPLSGTMLDVFAKASGGAFEGMHAMMIKPSSDTPAFAEFVEKVRTHHGDEMAEAADNFDLELYGFITVLGEMLNQAGPDLTRESVLTAMKSLDNFDSGYLVPFTTLGKDVPVGIDSLFPARCCNEDGTWQVLGPAQADFSEE